MLDDDYLCSNWDTILEEANNAKRYEYIQDHLPKENKKYDGNNHSRNILSKDNIELDVLSCDAAIFLNTSFQKSLEFDLQFKYNLMKLNGDKFKIIANCENDFFDDSGTINTFLQSRVAEWKLRKIHIFVDASNFVQTRNSMRFLEVIYAGRNISRKVVVGSLSKNKNSNHEFNQTEWQDLGYEVAAFTRVWNHEIKKEEEQINDDVLHAAMQSDILKDFPDKRTMIILTGDGNMNKGRTSFPTVIEQALVKKSGNAWNVELYSWSRSTSAIFKKFHDAYPEHFALTYLNDIEKLYFNEHENGNKDNIPLKLNHSSRITSAALPSSSTKTESNSLENINKKNVKIKHKNQDHKQRLNGWKNGDGNRKHSKSAEAEACSVNEDLMARGNPAFDLVERKQLNVWPSMSYQRVLSSLENSVSHVKSKEGLMGRRNPAFDLVERERRMQSASATTGSAAARPQFYDLSQDHVFHVDTHVEDSNGKYQPNNKRKKYELNELPINNKEVRQKKDQDENKPFPLIPFFPSSL